MSGVWPAAESCGHDEEQKEVKTGTLTCGGNHTYDVSRFMPRFVDADKYADSFSRQRLYVRKHFSHYRDDRSGDAQFLPTTGFSADAMKSGFALEIGAGTDASSMWSSGLAGASSVWI